jgi:hypothetical protein
METHRNPKAGLQAMLTPDNCVLILIDHQPFQFAGLRSHDTQTIINNVVGLAKSAKAFNVPTSASATKTSITCRRPTSRFYAFR